MNIEEFKATVVEQFLDESPEQISLNDKFRDLDSYDSLTGMSIIAIISDDYGVDIPIEEYRTLTTINELFDYVKKKNNGSLY